MSLIALFVNIHRKCEGSEMDENDDVDEEILRLDRSESPCFTSNYSRRDYSDDDLESELCEEFRDFEFHSSESESINSDGTYTKEQRRNIPQDSTKYLFENPDKRPKSSFSLLRYDSNRGICEKRTPTPRLCTRLHERSSSLVNLRQDNIHAMFRDRELLSKAVYEEWYFRKLMEERAAREREKLRQQRALERQKKEAEDVRRKSQLEYQRWCNQKRGTVQQQKNRKSSNSQIRSTTNTTLQIRAKAEVAFNDWLQQKKMASKRVGTKKSKSSTSDSQELLQNGQSQDHEKKTAAEASYRVWKQKADALALTKQREEMLKKKQKVAKEQKQQREKTEAAQKAFAVWKAFKDAHIKHQVEKERKRTRAKLRTEQVRATERLYQAEQAFEDWIERVEHRKKFGRSGPVSPVPWNPGGRPVQLP